jgi:16S rRNA (guanine527-N7)-methyltransferase
MVLGLFVSRETPECISPDSLVSGMQGRTARNCGRKMLNHLELLRLCKLNGLEIRSGQLDLLRRYVEVLLEWNSRINLVSRKDEESIWSQHILHSLTPLFHIVLQESTHVLDLGTGGGLPGIPLAIMRPDIDFTLVDSIRKKTLALEDMISTLNLKNVKVLCARAEELGAGGANDVGFDIVVARAVAPIKELIRWSVPLTRNRTHNAITFSSQLGTTKKEVLLRMPLLLAMKGGNLDVEIASAKAKFRDKEIILANLSIKGHEDVGLIDKKLVIVAL